MTHLRIQDAGKINPKISASIKNTLEKFKKNIDKLNPYRPTLYREQVLKRMEGSFQALAKKLQATYPKQDLRNIFVRVAASFPENPEYFTMVYLAAVQHDATYANTLKPLVEKFKETLESHSISVFFLGLQENPPESFGGWVAPAFSLRLLLAASVKEGGNDLSLATIFKALKDYKDTLPRYPVTIAREIHHCYREVVASGKPNGKRKLPLEVVLALPSQKLKETFFSEKIFSEFFLPCEKEKKEKIERLCQNSSKVFSEISNLLSHGKLSEIDSIMNKELNGLFESTAIEDYRGLPSFLKLEKEHLLDSRWFHIEGFLSKENFKKLEILTQYPLPQWFCGEKQTVLNAFTNDTSLFDFLNQKSFEEFFLAFGEEFLNLCVKAGYSKKFSLPLNLNYEKLPWTTVFQFAYPPKVFVKTFLGSIKSAEDIEFARLAAEKNPTYLSEYLHAISKERASRLRKAILKEPEETRRNILKTLPETDPIWTMVDWEDLIVNCVSEELIEKYGVKRLLAAKVRASTFLEKSTYWNSSAKDGASNSQSSDWQKTRDERLKEAVERLRSDQSLRFKWLTARVINSNEARRHFITDFYETSLWDNFKEIKAKRIDDLTIARDITSSKSYKGTVASRVNLLKSLFEAPYREALSAGEKRKLIKNLRNSEVRKLLASLKEESLRSTAIDIGYQYASLFPKKKSRELCDAIEQTRINELSGSNYLRYLAESIKDGKEFFKKQVTPRRKTHYYVASKALLERNNVEKILDVIREKPALEANVLSLLESTAKELLPKETHEALALEGKRISLSEKDFFELLVQRRKKGESLICVPELKTSYEIAVAILNTSLKLKELKSLHEKVDAAVFSEACHLVNLSVKKDAGNAPYWIELIEKLGWDVCNDLSHVISITNWKAGHGNHYNSAYKQWEIPKKNGGKRLISSPISTLRIIQRRIYEKLLLALPVHEASFGFVPNRSIVDNAALHVAKPCVVCVDIKSCFPSVKYPLVASTLLRELKGVLQPNTIRLVAEICSAEGGLPIGAPTSPVILNLVLKKTDTILTEHAKKLGCSYSRYADDMTFSGDNETTKMIGIAKGTLSRIGLNLDPKKTNIFRRGRRQCCTGLVVNEKVNVNRIYLRRLRAEVHRLSKGRTPTWMGERDTPEAVIGRINFVNSVSPEKALHLKQILKNAGVA